MSRKPILSQIVLYCNSRDETHKNVNLERSITGASRRLFCVIAKRGGRE